MLDDPQSSAGIITKNTSRSVAETVDGLSRLLVDGHRRNNEADGSPGQVCVELVPPGADHAAEPGCRRRGARTNVG